MRKVWSKFEWDCRPASGRADGSITTNQSNSTSSQHAIWPYFDQNPRSKHCNDEPLQSGGFKCSKSQTCNFVYSDLRSRFLDWLDIIFRFAKYPGCRLLTQFLLHFAWFWIFWKFTLSSFKSRLFIMEPLPHKVTRYLLHLPIYEMGFHPKKPMEFEHHSSLWTDWIDGSIITMDSISWDLLQIL